MTLRYYQEGDVPVMAQLFYDTVHAVNARDYTDTQLNAWATGQIDDTAWHKRFSESHTLIAVIDEKPVGFANMYPDGYLDMLYVHPRYQGQGVATSLCDALESACVARPLYSDVSITARPFFEKRGYRVLKKQEVICNGVPLTNFRMIFLQSGTEMPAKQAEQRPLFRKLLIAVFMEFVVFALALWLHLVMSYATWCQWQEPALWDYSYELLDGSLWIAVAQYMAVCTAFLLAWLLWHWPGHKLSYILLAWGIMWVPMAMACTGDCTRLPYGPMNMPFSLFAFPFFTFICVLEALLIGLLIKTPPK